MKQTFFEKSNKKLLTDPLPEKDCSGRSASPLSKW